MIPPATSPAPLVASVDSRQRADAPIADAVRKLLEQAMASDNAADVDTVAKYARAANPESADTIAAMVDDWKAGREAARVRRLLDADFFALIKGQVEFGGFLTTGNNDNIGIHGSINLTRDGLKWRHRLRVLADYQRSNGVTTREHYLADLESKVTLDDRWFGYGTGQFESDRFLGIDTRYSVSTGVGYTGAAGRLTTFDVELGPAFRVTHFGDGRTSRTVAARGSLELAYKLGRALILSNSSAAYLETGNSTLSSTTALKARLIGPLSGQVSYAIQYESQPPVGRVTTDTTSRASLVYQF